MHVILDRGASVMEGLGRLAGADQEGVGDDAERLDVDLAAAVAEQLGEAAVDQRVLALGRRG